MTARCLCVHRSYTFGGLAPGSQYTVEVICISGERKSEPTTVIIYTSKITCLNYM